MINVISFPGLGLEFTVNRVAFSVGNFNIYWYGIIIAVGLALALLYGIRECNKVGLKADDFYNMVLICIHFLRKRRYKFLCSFRDKKNNNTYK